MLSEEQRASRSPSPSVQSASVYTGPTSRLTARLSLRSSSSETDNDKIVPQAPPLPSNLRASIKSSSSSTNSSPTQLALKPASIGVSALKAFNPLAFQQSSARYDSPGQKTTLTQRDRNQTTLSDRKRTLQALLGGGKERNRGNGRLLPMSASYSRPGKSNRSIFEKVDTHDGHTSYLGSGSFGQIEDCIRNSLSQSRSHPDFGYYDRKHDYSYKSLTRASVLEDYSYDGILSPKHHISIPVDTHHHHISIPIDTHHHHISIPIDTHHHHISIPINTHHGHHHHHYNDHKKHAAELSLREIREVNDALAKYNIPVFSYPSNHHHQPQPVGDVLSACEQILAGRPHGTGQNHYSPYGHTNGYPSSSVQNVASHLFNNNQAPHDAVQGVASNLFGNHQQNTYNPGYPPQNQGYPQQNQGYPPQNSGSSSQGVLSRLFGGGGGQGASSPPSNGYPPQNQGYPPRNQGYPPQNQGYPPQNQGYPPQNQGYPPQNSGSAGQSVLSRLFSGNS